MEEIKYEQIPDSVIVEMVGKPREELTEEDFVILDKKVRESWAQEEKEEKRMAIFGSAFFPVLLLILAFIFKWFHSPVFWVFFILFTSLFITAYFMVTGKIDIDKLEEKINDI